MYSEYDALTIHMDVLEYSAKPYSTYFFRAVTVLKHVTSIDCCRQLSDSSGST
jgi:hypothetical protein